MEVENSGEIEENQTENGGFTLETGAKKQVEIKFKKPILVGKIGRLPKKIKEIIPQTPQTPEAETTEPEYLSEIPNSDVEYEETETGSEDVSNVKVEGILRLYKEPSWAGTPNVEYYFEILKEGSIIDRMALVGRSFWVFGRLQECEISMQHPTVSRYHAVLQYKNGEKPGFYVYDLGSTHGTFLNKKKLRPKIYARIQVGHMLKLGCSTRAFILNGPPEDAEEESEFTVTQLKEKKLKNLLAKQKAEEPEEKWADWGMGEDPEDDPEIAINTSGYTENEHLYLNDPKKALRAYFERQGLEVEYNCTEAGLGQFQCTIELPVKTGFITAEVVHKGKKKETAALCALEACRILDNQGLLTQTNSNNESRKRKLKNWEENDFYDSDDDTFLDRTGTIEKKREKRMNAKNPPKAETYETLMEKEKELSNSIKKIEGQLKVKLQNAQKKTEIDEENCDSLDAYMNQLKSGNNFDEKSSISRLKTELVGLKKEHEKIIKLANIARPTSLPPLVAKYETIEEKKENRSKVLPIFGKRKKIPVAENIKPKTNIQTVCDKEDVEEFEAIEKDEISMKFNKILTKIEAIQDEDEQNSKYRSLDETLDTFLNNLETSSVENKRVEIREESSVEKIENDEPKLENVEQIDVKIEQKKLKNSHRTQVRRQMKADVEKRKGYVEDAAKEDYNMWVPPQDQSGDGKTKLNEKFGY